jgi:hypothetical protein
MRSWKRAGVGRGRVRKVGVLQEYAYGDEGCEYGDASDSRHELAVEGVVVVAGLFWTDVKSEKNVDIEMTSGFIEGRQASDIFI